MVWLLDNCDINSLAAQIFGKLQSNEATACKYDCFWMSFFYISMDTKRIFHCAKHKKICGRGKFGMCISTIFFIDGG